MVLRSLIDSSPVADVAAARDKAFEGLGNLLVLEHAAAATAVNCWVLLEGAGATAGEGERPPKPASRYPALLNSANAGNSLFAFSGSLKAGASTKIA